MTSGTQDSEKIRAEIIHAAESRFRTYGYSKSTMAEIAADTGMSAANLYRYFSSKQAIAEVCAWQCMEELQEKLKAVAALPDATTEQRLHYFTQTALHYNYTLMHESPRLNELVDTITQHHRELIYERNVILEGVIAEILEQGIRNGEFVLDDVKRTASAILKATVMFTVPVFMHLYTIEEFEQMAVDVVSLIINGLENKADPIPG